MNTSLSCAVATLAAACIALPSITLAQAWPAKPVRVVIPWPAGGSNDIVGRVVMQELSRTLGQQFVIDNRAGASGVVGADLVAKTPADGYTLMVHSTTHVGNAHLYGKKLTYDTMKDFTGVGMLSSQPGVLTVHPALPVKTLKDFIALAKAKPRQINYSSSGNGSAPHLQMALLISMAGIDITHVPYKSATPAVTDLVGGHVQMMIVSLPSVWPQVKAGRLRALALSTAKRSAFAPEMPIIADTVPGYEAGQWWGMLAPGKTPPDVVRKLNGELNRILASEDMRPRLADQGAEPVLMTPEAFTEYVRAEITKWRRIAQDRNIKP